MDKIVGKGGISAIVLADSVSPQGKRFTTLEIEYPRIILAETNTHRQLSKNSSSSRAIPFNSMIQNLTGMPVRFGAANAGMQDKGEEYEQEGYYPRGVWNNAKAVAISYAASLKEFGYHKQVYNRLLEPFQMMKTIISGTEWNNFFHLRLDEAADPTIQELARVMKQAMDRSVPVSLEHGQWHLPKVKQKELEEHGLDNAIKMSCARCAAVSYRKGEYDLAKCLEVYDRLVNTERVHASSLEHCATPVMYANYFSQIVEWEEGVTHVRKDGTPCSGNLVGWIQWRQLVPNESV